MTAESDIINLFLKGLNYKKLDFTQHIEESPLRFSITLYGWRRLSKRNIKFLKKYAPSCAKLCIRVRTPHVPLIIQRVNI